MVASFSTPVAYKCLKNVSFKLCLKEQQRLSFSSENFQLDSLNGKSKNQRAHI